MSDFTSHLASTARRLAAIMLARDPSPKALAAGDRNPGRDEGGTACRSSYSHRSEGRFNGLLL